MPLGARFRLAVMYILASAPAISATENTYLNAYAMYFGIPLSGVFQQKGDSITLSQSFRQVADLNSKRVITFVEESPSAVESLVQYIHLLPSQYVTEANKRNLIFQIISTLVGLEAKKISEDLSVASKDKGVATKIGQVSQLPKETHISPPRIVSYELVEKEHISANESYETLKPVPSYLQHWRVGGGIRSAEPIFSNSSRTTKTVNGIVVENSTIFETADSDVAQGFLDLSYKVPNMPVRLGGKLLFPSTIEHSFNNYTLEHSRPWVLTPYVELNFPPYFERVQPFIAYSSYSYDATLRLPLGESATVLPLAYRQDVEKISVGADYRWVDTWLSDWSLNLSHPNTT